MNLIGQSLLAGLFTGSLYALLGLGLSLTWGLLGPSTSPTSRWPSWGAASACMLLLGLALGLRHAFDPGQPGGGRPPPAHERSRRGRRAAAVMMRP